MKIMLLLLSFSMMLFVPVSYAGDVYVARGDVFLREAPPKAPFYVKTNRLGMVRKNEQVKVLEVKQVFLYEWLKIETYGESKQIGWVYNGDHDGLPYFEKLGGN